MRDVKIMDIAMNLARIGNWAADDFDKKEKRIAMFLDQTDIYLQDIDMSLYPKTTQQTLTRFIQVFHVLRTKLPHATNERLLWAEDMLTWSNILTHKARVKKI